MTTEAQARKARKEAKMQARRAQLVLSRQDHGGALAWRGWFDGSAHPNPGKLGIGALLLGPDGERIEVSQAAGYGSSSDAEYAALTALLQTALGVHPPPAQLLLYGDSQVVINDVLGTTPQGAKGLELHRASVVALLQQFTDVSLQWLPRHRNGEADRLSQLAIASFTPEASVPGSYPQGTTPAITG